MQKKGNIKKQMISPITVIYSTRNLDEAYIEHIKESSGLGKKIEVIPFVNNGEKSLTQIYNEGLKKAKNDIIVFCHDDLFFETPFWGVDVVDHFTRNRGFGILGIAGTNKMVNGRWWEHRENMFGIVNHADKEKKWTSMYSQPQGIFIKRAVVVDGLFFAVHRQRVKKNFDESFKGFHFYEIDFCINNHLSGVKIGVVTNIRVTHFSIGETNDLWEENKLQFEEKYKENLPVSLND